MDDKHAGKESSPMTAFEPRRGGLKMLFLSTKATRPSHRFRVEQMLPFLEQCGHHCSVGFFPKNPIARFWFYRQLPRFDVVLIQQRTLDLTELRIVRSLSSKLIFDLDDSVMLDPGGRADQRRERRFAAMVRTADLVICGNQFLHDRVAECGNGSARTIPISILPTAIDTHRFRPGLSPTQSSDRVTIGWTGSRATNRYLNAIFPALSQISGPVELKVMSDTKDDFDFSRLGSLPVRFVKWSAETEVTETAEFDIGLMPLPDDNSTRGKCGCKALQYMALGIPAVCSPVGVNRDIIEHGRNGFLPEAPRDWISTLNNLVGDAELRRRIGRAGRSTVDSRYSLHNVASQLASLLEQATIARRRSA